MPLTRSTMAIEGEHSCRVGHLVLGSVGGRQPNIISVWKNSTVMKIPEQRKFVQKYVFGF